jgi:hypothetical protein
LACGVFFVFQQAYFTGQRFRFWLISAFQFFRMSAFDFKFHRAACQPVAEWFVYLVCFVVKKIRPLISGVWPLAWFQLSIFQFCL